jgi:hypothetical protein
MIRVSKLQVSLATLFAVALIGCDGGASAPPAVVKVKGTLIHGGKPLPQANIAFHPVNATVVGTATTGPEGKFELSTVPGENVVTVSVVDTGGAGVMSADAIISGGGAPLTAPGPKETAAATASQIPSEYSGSTTSPLKVTVGNDGEADLKVEF